MYKLLDQWPYYLKTLHKLKKIPKKKKKGKKDDGVGTGNSKIKYKW